MLKKFTIHVLFISFVLMLGHSIIPHHHEHHHDHHHGHHHHGHHHHGHHHHGHHHHGHHHVGIEYEQPDYFLKQSNILESDSHHPSNSEFDGCNDEAHFHSHHFQPLVTHSKKFQSDFHGNNNFIFYNSPHAILFNHNRSNIEYDKTPLIHSGKRAPPQC